MGRKDKTHSQKQNSAFVILFVQLNTVESYQDQVLVDRDESWVINPPDLKTNPTTRLSRTQIPSYPKPLIWPLACQPDIGIFRDRALFLYRRA